MMNKFIYIISFLIFLIGSMIGSCSQKSKIRSVEIKGIFYKYLNYEISIHQDSSKLLVINEKTWKNDTTFLSQNPLSLQFDQKFTTTKITSENNEITINAKAIVPPVETFANIGYHNFRSGDTINYKSIKPPFHLLGKFINYDINSTFPALSYTVRFLQNGETKSFKYSNRIFEPELVLDELKESNLLIIDNIIMTVYDERVRLRPHLNYVN